MTPDLVFDVCPVCGGTHLTSVEGAACDACDPGDPPAGPAVLADYTNWRGERRQRSIRPVGVWHGESEYHPGAQWFLRAVDVETGEARDFALSGFHGFEVAK